MKGRLDPTRVLLERETLADLTWGVFCLTLYEGELTHAEAVDEVIAARKHCDCGGEHVVRPTGKRER